MGKLYGVGVGPGDSGLITIKAIQCIRSADIICLPKKEKETCRAYLIASEAVPEIEKKEIICCDFKMSSDIEISERSHRTIYSQIKSKLDDGLNIAFLTLGDPTTYSTFSYIYNFAVRDHYQTEIISGVTSYDALAASLGIILCEGNEELHIGTSQSNIEKLVKLSGTKIIMKTGKNMPMIKSALIRARKDKDFYVYAVSNCGLSNEMKYYRIEDIPETSEYMTTIIIKDKK